MGEVPEPGAPRWSQHDRDVVLAWNEWEDGLCGKCGVPRDEAWSKDAIGKWEGHVRRCHVCRATEQAAEGYQANEKRGMKVDMAGLKPTARPVTPEAEDDGPQ